MAAGLLCIILGTRTWPVSAYQLHQSVPRFLVRQSMGLGPLVRVSAGMTGR